MLVELLDVALSDSIDNKSLFLNKILKNSYEKITAGTIKFLSVEDLEAAIISYIIRKSFGISWISSLKEKAHITNKSIKLNRLPKIYQMYFAMSQIEIYLHSLLRINKSGKVPLEKKDEFTELFKNFMEREKENLIPLAISGYEVFKRQDVSTMLKELSGNFNKKKVENLSKMLVNSNVDKINFIKQNPEQFITGKDFINKDGVTVLISTLQNGENWKASASYCK